MATKVKWNLERLVAWPLTQSPDPSDPPSEAFKPKIVDTRNLTERNREKVQSSISQLELIERQLEAEIAERQERLRHVRLSIKAFIAAGDVLKAGENDPSEKPFSGSVLLGRSAIDAMRDKKVEV